MKTQIHLVIHKAVLILLLAVASWSIGFLVILVNGEFVGSTRKDILGIVILLVPSVLVVWGLRLAKQSRQGRNRVISWSQILLYVATIVYCSCRILVRFDPRWGFSFGLVASLALVATIALALRLFFFQMEPQKQIEQGDSNTAP